MPTAIAEGLRDQGIAVDVAYDGHEAVAKLNLNPYDVVVLDRDLPGIHGDKLCRMITRSEDPAMILMLTAAGTPDDRVTGLALGADDYLPKPFHFPELVLRIRALARRKPTAQPPHPASRGHRTRPAHRHRHPRRRHHRSHRQRTRRAPSPAQSQPRRLTAEKLLEQAWDENTDPFTNTVRVTIARLRRKLGEPQVIQTTPGIGYRITTTRQPRNPQR